MANKDETDFMLEEYKQIAKAFSDLYIQMNNILKLYLTLISIGSTAIVTILTVGSNLFSETTTIFGLLSIEQLAGTSFFVLAIVGMTILASMIGTRIEMLRYARTINCIRGYFANKHTEIKNYLVLPTYDDKTPPFFESLNRPFIWQVIMLSSLNSILIIVSVNVYFSIPQINFIGNVFFVALIFIGQMFMYYGICWSREKEYIAKIEKPKQQENKDAAK